VAQITWIIEPGRWHIDFLRAEQQTHLLPMLAAFRALWTPEGDQPSHSEQLTTIVRYRGWRAPRAHDGRARSTRSTFCPNYPPKRPYAGIMKDEDYGRPTEALLKSKLKKTSGTAAVANYERDRAAEIAATGGFDQSFDKLLHNHYRQALNGISR
jgi:hypothetical protein